jgi:chemotaxis protein methyltransferase CheR
MMSEEEIALLVNDMHELHGYDFSFYSRSSLRRRITRLFTLDKFPSFAEFRYRIRSDEEFARRFVEEITVNVTEMFRDAAFYKTLREEVLPKLGTHPFIRIWHAGCSTGEEVFSVAIFLHEIGLLNKTLIYATDLNPGVLQRARSGIFPLGYMKQYSENYIAAGGQQDFSSYYTAHYNGAKFNDALRSRMVFSTHNLVSDHSFNEFHLIVCRNVLIYFDRELQERVFKLFDDSLASLSYLALGSKETIRFSPIAQKFKQIGKEKIWKRTE